jgi:hypothetical protein
LLRSARTYVAGSLGGNEPSRPRKHADEVNEEGEFEND